MQALSPSATLAAAPAVVPVILAGGSGSRLWPLSREQFPKQFLALGGERSLLQETVLRASHIPQATPPLIIGTEAHRFLIVDQLRDLGIEGASIILEPEGRNTAPAAAVAAHYIAATYGAGALAFIMAADHAMRDLPGFLAAVSQASTAAASGRMVVFGIKPTRAETGYGYLEIGDRVEGDGALMRVQAFVEKPDAERAEQFLQQGRHCWNAGLFLFQAQRLLDELGRLEPELCQQAGRSLQAAVHEAPFIRIEEQAFRACRADSIDYAVMEKVQDLVAVPLDAGWDDVGCWSYLGNLPATDAADNCFTGNVVSQNSGRNLVYASSRLVALVNVHDHIVVETKDALLVTTRDHAQNVKGLVQQLQKENRPQAVAHSKVRRPWGSYESIAAGERFQVKRIVVGAGEKLSLQMHHHRAEHWIVVKGTARVTCGEQEFLLSENQSTYIPLGQKHRLENPGLVPLEIIEVQSGAYLGEDDIVRFDDQYGRISVKTTVTEVTATGTLAPPQTAAVGAAAAAAVAAQQAPAEIF